MNKSIGRKVTIEARPDTIVEAVVIDTDVHYEFCRSYKVLRIVVLDPGAPDYGYAPGKLYWIPQERIR